jgi:putative ABC transport system permease protein
MYQPTWFSMGVEKVWYEVRHATGRLRRDVKFTLTTLVTLALGVGATVLIFSVANVVFLRNLSYPNASRLVWATEFFPNLNRSMVLTPQYVAWKQQSVAFERLEAMGPTFGTNLRNANRPAERIQTAHVTPGFFAMIGISPRLGPGFDPNAIASDQHVAILSDMLWRSYFQADSGVVGNNVNLNGKPFTIVGVMPRGFVYVDGPDVAVWLPDAVTPAAMVPGRSTESMRVIGRLQTRN